MKQRPILFSAPMVRALLAGQKGQTRRLVAPQPRGLHYLQTMWGTSPPPDPVDFGDKWLWREVGPDYPDDAQDDRRCPFGVPGDQLWVREALVAWPDGWHYVADNAPVQLPADDPRVGEMYSWAHHKATDHCVSIHMPRFASRLTLEISDVRAQRLHDITEDDARAEGVTPVEMETTHRYRRAFAALWDELNADRASWSSNPWVWAVSFRRVLGLRAA